MDALHAKAKEQLNRLFPNRATHVPDGTEEEPSSDAEDDFDEPATTAQSAQQCAETEHARTADVAVANGVPALRPSRTAATAANVRMNVNDMQARSELI